VHDFLEGQVLLQLVRVQIKLVVVVVLCGAGMLSHKSGENRKDCRMVIRCVAARNDTEGLRRVAERLLINDRLYRGIQDHRD